MNRRRLSAICIFLSLAISAFAQDLTKISRPEEAGFSSDRLARITQFFQSEVDQGAIPGYTFVDTGVPGALYTAISPLQGGSDLVTFFVAVDDVDSAVKRAEELGGRVIQEPQHVPGVAFALIADPQGHIVGLTHQG